LRSKRSTRFKKYVILRSKRSTRFVKSGNCVANEVLVEKRKIAIILLSSYFQFILLSSYSLFITMD